MRLTHTFIVIGTALAVVGCSGPSLYETEAPRASSSQGAPGLSESRTAFDNLSLGPPSTDGLSANVSVAGQIARPPAAGAILGAPGPGPVQQALMNAYLGAVRGAPAACRLRAEVLAAIAQVESGSAGGQTLSGHRVVPGVYGPLLSGGEVAAVPDTDEGRLDGDEQWDRAVGPMQFIPSAWAAFGADGDGDGSADPQNVYDAVVSTSLYLCAGGRDLSQPTELASAILSYNHSGPYVLAVLDWVAYFGAHGLVAIGPVSIPVPEQGPTARRRTEPATVTAEVIKEAVEKAARLPVAPPLRKPGIAAGPVAYPASVMDRPYTSTTVPAPTRTTTATSATTTAPGPTTTTPPDQHHDHGTESDHHDSRTGPDHDDSGTGPDHDDSGTGPDHDSGTGPDDHDSGTGPGTGPGTGHDDSGTGDRQHDSRTGPDHHDLVSRRSVTGRPSPGVFEGPTGSWSGQALKDSRWCPAGRVGATDGA